MRQPVLGLPLVLLIAFLDPHCKTVAAPVPSLWKSVATTMPTLKRMRGVQDSPHSNRRQENATGLRSGEPGTEPLTSGPSPGKNGLALSETSPAGQSSKEADYHAKCKARGGGSCLRWEGLTCEEVDSILHNVQRYSASVSVPRQSEALSRSGGEALTRGLGGLSSFDGHGGERQRAEARAVEDTSVREGRALAAKRKLVSELQGVGAGVERTRGPAGNVVLQAARPRPLAPPPLPRPASGALPAPWSSARMLHAHRQAQARQPPPPTHQGKPLSFPSVDAEGHVAYRLGDGLEPSAAFPRGRYKILRSLGSGTYGKVVECWDRQEGAYCAVKVVRAVPKYRSAAATEVKVLQELRGEHGCVRMLRSFPYQGHVCLVFELLGPNLYDIMRAVGFQPLSVRDIHLIARQVIESLCLVHGRAIVHTDVKPENVLLVEQLHKRGLVFRPGQMNAQDLRVKLVDFGSAVYHDSQRASVVSTRHYRAPEIILKLGWSYPCDLWSMGCILYELYTGEVLFGVSEEVTHLAAMQRVIQPFPQWMLHKALYRGVSPSLIRKAGDRLELDVEGVGLPEASLKALHRSRPLSAVIRDGLLLDLIRAMLQLDPAKRIAASEALMHPFFGAP